MAKAGEAHVRSKAVSIPSSLTGMRSSALSTAWVSMSALSWFATARPSGSPIVADFGFVARSVLRPLDLVDQKTGRQLNGDASVGG
ncbi:hypothetical protein GCM10022237_05740 [Nocardioides ginsengisoli]|uniref:Uncharacterized protein n=1 Tax=Nocardioides ginsengisoli TaxID=363868 RepID=A0ABW3VVR8_9ACTN